jgi:hypothetical protein
MRCRLSSAALRGDPQRLGAPHLDGVDLAAARAEALGHIWAYSTRQRLWFRKLGAWRIGHRFAVKVIVSHLQWPRCHGSSWDSARPRLLTSESGQVCVTRRRVMTAMASTPMIGS